MSLLCSVYDTATHTRLGKLERPASAAADPAAPCGLLWRGDRELYVSWARHVTVVRVVGSLLPLGQPGLLPAAGRTLQVVASFDTGCTALGAAPFGADIAVLAWGPASDAPLADSLPVSSSTAGGRIILTASSTAEEQDGPADGQAAAASASPAKGDSAAGAAADSGAPPVAAADGTPPSPSDAATQQLPPPQLQQQLSLCFYSRQGQLLAADALGSSCSAAERRWHQLALSYPGDADLRLAAAAAPTPPRGSQPPVLPARSTAGSRAGSRAGSVAGSGRATPSKPRLPPSDATSPTAPSVDSTSADGAGEAAGQHAHAATDMQPQRQHEQQQDQQQQQQREQGVEGQQQQWRQQKVQQYKWWRDGEDPLYFVCTPSVSTLVLYCSPPLQGGEQEQRLIHPPGSISSLAIRLRCSQRCRATTCSPAFPCRHALLCRRLLSDGLATATTACRGWPSAGGLPRRWVLLTRTAQASASCSPLCALGDAATLQWPTNNLEEKPSACAAASGACLTWGRGGCSPLRCSPVGGTGGAWGAVPAGAAGSWAVRGGCRAVPQAPAGGWAGLGCR